MGIRYLEVVSRDTAALAEAVATDPAAGVACYDEWDLAQLARHVGMIQRWVTDVVRTRATTRPPWPDLDEVADDGLPEWLRRGAADLVAALAATDPDEEVWTFSPTGSTCAFWHRRMALETALHRWDAEDALGREATVADALAVEGIEEALRVYLEPRLQGRDVGGDGQRVAFVTGSADGWTLLLHPEGVEVADGVGEADAVISGPALDVWLLLMCRRGLDAVEVSGDRAAAQLAVRAASMVPGPAG